MTAVWDATLPQALQVQGYSEGIGDGLVEYAPDVGPSITRARTAAVMRPLVGTMVVTAAQLATFRTFFVTTLLQGSLPFTFPDQSGAGGSVLCKFLKQSPPSWQNLGGTIYQINLSMVVLP